MSLSIHEGFACTDLFIMKMNKQLEDDSSLQIFLSSSQTTSTQPYNSHYGHNFFFFCHTEHLLMWQIDIQKQVNMDLEFDILKKAFAIIFFEIPLVNGVILCSD